MTARTDEQKARACERTRRWRAANPDRVKINDTRKLARIKVDPIKLEAWRERNRRKGNRHYAVNRERLRERAREYARQRRRMKGVPDKREEMAERKRKTLAAFPLFLVLLLLRAHEARERRREYVRRHMRRKRAAFLYLRAIGVVELGSRETYEARRLAAIAYAMKNGLIT